MKKLLLLCVLAVNSVCASGAIVAFAGGFKDGAQKIFIGKNLPNNGGFEKPIIHPAITACVIGGLVYKYNMDEWNRCFPSHPRISRLYVLGHVFFFSGDMSTDVDFLASSVGKNLIDSFVGAGISYSCIKLLQGM